MTPGHLRKIFFGQFSIIKTVIARTRWHSLIYFGSDKVKWSKLREAIDKIKTSCAKCTASLHVRVSDTPGLKFLGFKDARCT